MKKLVTAFAFSAMTATGAMADGPQGVTDDMITLGTYTDLSGPLAVWGVPEANGLRMRVDEINAAGGIHGRQLEIIIEDTQYQVPRAIQVANKLMRRDQIFAMVGALGTPMNLAIMPQQIEAGIPNMFPMSADVEMYEPLDPMKYAFFRSYTDQFRAGVAYFKENGDFSTPCIAQLANEAGESMALGVTQQLAEYDMKVAVKTEHSATESDMLSSVTTLKSAGCDIVFLAGGVRDSILVVATSKKLGFEPTFVTGMVSYMDAVATAADGAMDGLYLVSPFVFANAEDSEGEAKRILESYNEIYGEKMAPQAQLGYVFIDLIAVALEAAGRDLTTEGFLAATEAITSYVDPIGGQLVRFGPEDHQGIETLIMAKVEDGKWTIAARGLDY